MYLRNKYIFRGTWWNCWENHYLAVVSTLKWNLIPWTCALSLLLAPFLAFKTFSKLYGFPFYDNIQRTKNQLCDCLCVVSQVWGARLLWLGKSPINILRMSEFWFWYLNHQTGLKFEPLKRFELSSPGWLATVDQGQTVNLYKMSDVIKKTDAGVITQPWHVVLSQHSISTISFIEDNVLAGGSNSLKSMSLWVGVDRIGSTKLESGYT